MPDPSHIRQRLIPLGGALVALVLIAVGWVVWQGEEDRPVSSVEAGSPSVEPAALPTPRPAPVVAGAPRRIVVPALSIDAQIDPVRTVDRTLIPPTDPGRIGWWADGARPGDRRGTALVTGHTVHSGGGAFDDLEDLRRDDRVEVHTTRGMTTYTVTSVQELSLEAVAARHRELFDQGGDARLVLVTCEDWDGQAYQSSVVVTATPAAALG